MGLIQRIRNVCHCRPVRSEPRLKLTEEGALRLLLSLDQNPALLATRGPADQKPAAIAESIELLRGLEKSGRRHGLSREQSYRILVPVALDSLQIPKSILHIGYGSMRFAMRCLVEALETQAVGCLSPEGMASLYSGVAKIEKFHYERVFLCAALLANAGVKEKDILSIIDLINTCALRRGRKDFASKGEAVLNAYERLLSLMERDPLVRNVFTLKRELVRAFNTPSVISGG